MPTDRLMNFCRNSVFIASLKDPWKSLPRTICMIYSVFSLISNTPSRGSCSKMLHSSLKSSGVDLKAPGSSSKKLFTSVKSCILPLMYRLIEASSKLLSLMPVESPKKRLRVMMEQSSCDNRTVFSC